METKDLDLKKQVALCIGALGVVYGDIGTSPLYAVKECFEGKHAIPINEVNIFGVVSLILWSLIIVVCLKYVAFILRADNRGEGGTFALLALLAPSGSITARTKAFLFVAAAFGSALLYGDGVITPAISVLSAIEGLEVLTVAAKPFILPITCVILILLFLIQSKGTESIGKYFGPIMIVWFFALGSLGIKEITVFPQIMKAFNPVYAVKFFVANKGHGVVVLASVVLCITGGEALYADLGHFGRKAIRWSWLTLALPGLALNYIGQGALLLSSPEVADNPFYGLVPHSLLIPMVLLSTMATIIASQAMITGVFSLTQQSVQLGFLPRVRIIHTSSDARGQIYVPTVNYLMMVGCLALVLAFKNSSGLAGAYGIAVTATMGITSILYFFVTTKLWKWSLWRSVPLLILFMSFDLSFFGANLMKIIDGGWLTILIAVSIFILMYTWYQGRQLLSEKRQTQLIPVRNFIRDIKESGKRKPIHRIDRLAVFMSIMPKGVPVSILHFFKHTKSLYKTVIILTIRFTETPKLSCSERLTIEDVGEGFYRVEALYGYMEKPDVPAVMEMLRRRLPEMKRKLIKINEEDLEFEFLPISYFLGRETLVISGLKSRMAKWRKFLFAFMSRNAGSAAYYFNIPPGDTLELGEQISI